MQKILLVTERCRNHSGLPLMLAGAGYHVVEPRVPSEAIKVLETGDFDLVVIGHCVPLRARNLLTQLILSTYPRMPIVCVTESPSNDWPMEGPLVLASCETLLWSIEHVLNGNAPDLKRAPAKASPRMSRRHESV